MGTAPPKNLWRDALAESQRISSGQIDRGHAFPASLGLFWRLIIFGDDTRSVSARYLRIEEDTDEALQAAWPILKLALVAPFSGIAQQWTPTSTHYDGRAGGRFCGFKPCDISNALARVESALQAANEAGAHLLIFPELSLNGTHIEHLQALMCQPGNGVELVVAGSQHIERSSGEWVNRSTVLDRDGDVLWIHDKVLRYGSRNRRGGDLVEDIRLGDVLVLVETSVARIASVICLDFLCDKALHSLYQSAAPNLFLVPAMSPKLDDFRSRATSFAASLQAISIVSNSALNPKTMSFREQNDPDLGLVQLPKRGRDALQPHTHGWVRIYDLAHPSIEPGE